MDDLFDEDILKPAPEADGMVILSVANAYKKQYYLNPKFAKLPETIQEELQIMCGCDPPPTAAGNRPSRRRIRCLPTKRRRITSAVI